MITPHADGEPVSLSSMIAPQASSTVLRIVLGAQLRRLREGRDITLEEAGRAIRASHSKVSRMELGRVGFRIRDVADLLTLYGVIEEDDRRPLLSLVEKANQPGWWHNYNDVLPSWFETYVGLEESAAGIRNYEVQFVPGLLQSEGYARAVVRLGFPGAAPQEVERRVRLRLARQKLLHRPDPPHLWAVLDEAVLRRPLGGAEVMCEQIDHILQALELPNVTVQIVPFSVGGHAAAGGPFSILRFSQPDLPDVVYMEQLTSAVYLEKRDDVDRYLEVMERLCIEAEPVTRTRDILVEIRGELARRR
ncbi:transcriptional regulator with XRE-family HTH domain [Streptosporangium becharense]|uniref:Transcriptional regulator with XRE-family HTH domain n=1 Tax=Streptosporangium becharense TaxID=1816182 RepID=A0A7W9IMK1_9ACTN|nr:helix-turn-helix transcriptional regulator [Streptosporangium becharense]MBB2914464.1 transcriptional regulator with XRE-family HTH domain [Streptosporangium becharense]MBB5823504.1 transcriptional regulator with XRE-family HTH domain [Streptosporangium becharense]